MELQEKGARESGATFQEVMGDGHAHVGFDRPGDVLSRVPSSVLISV